MYRLVFTKQAQKDARKLADSNLKQKTMKLLDILKKNPFQEYPPYVRLLGDLKGTFSRRINIQYRLIYQVYDEEKIVKIIRTYYE